MAVKPTYGVLWLEVWLRQRPKARCCIDSPKGSEPNWRVSVTDERGELILGSGSTLARALQDFGEQTVQR